MIVTRLSRRATEVVEPRFSPGIRPCRGVDDLTRSRGKGEP